MQRHIITTADGSKTIQIEDWNEQYHSVHGAIQEAKHVYVKHGLLFFMEKSHELSNHPNGAKLKNNTIDLLEIGFGTGLNALLTMMEAEKNHVYVNYVGVEAFPVTASELQSLNYVEQLNVFDKQPLFEKMHHIPWEINGVLTPFFQLQKQNKLFEDITAKNQFDLIYFDAFGARVQPELWTESIFEIMYKALKSNGVLVTYAAKGSVRRAMQSVGFTVEKLSGPPGKREMLRAIKGD